jgi:hypothetical protein
MELLIPGLILVALMVYVSTKIKKNAARAYEQETIETTEFSIVKPEGFICPVDHKEGLIFAAYSKEYGRDQTDSVRQASAEIRVFADANFEDICERVKIDSVRIVSEDIGILNGAKSCVITTERIEGEITLDVIHKVVEGDEKIYQLTIVVLPEYKKDYSRKIDEILGSFTLK